MSPNFDLSNTVLFAIVIAVNFIFKLYRKKPLFDKNSLVSNSTILTIILLNMFVGITYAASLTVIVSTWLVQTITGYTYDRYHKSKA